MKLSILILVLIATTTTAFSQNYMDEIAKETCKCLTQITDDLNPEKYALELGLCMINASNPYKKQLKKDFKIDLDKIDTHAEELGRIIGIRMASACPDDLLLIAEKLNLTESSEESENKIQGIVTSIEDNKFIEFSVKNDEGKTSKYYWLTFIKSEIELPTNYKKLLDKNIQITYTEQEFFDVRIGEYRTFNVIQKLELIED